MPADEANKVPYSVLKKALTSKIKDYLTPKESTCTRCDCRWAERIVPNHCPCRCHSGELTETKDATIGYIMLEQVERAFKDGCTYILTATCFEIQEEAIPPPYLNMLGRKWVRYRGRNGTVPLYDIFTFVSA